MIILANSIRCFIRLLRLLFQFVVGLFDSALLRVKYGTHWYHTDIGNKTIQLWMQQVCNIIGLKVKQSGDYLRPNASLIVANHVSWLDIIALSSTVKSSFISKNEIKKWPIIGTLADITGTVFINRNSRSELNSAINSITKVIKNGKSVILFPEGTTSNGSSVKRFKSSLFQAAIESNCNIQPIAIRYTRNNKLDTIAPYIDNTNFVVHLLRIMCQSETTVHLHINKEIIPENKNRRKLTIQSEDKIKLSLTLNLELS